MRKRPASALLIVAVGLLIAGHALVLAAIFVPWLDLSTQFANPFGSGGFSPWSALVQAVILHHTVDFLATVAIVYLALAAGVVGYSLTLLRARDRHPRNAALGALSLYAVTTLVVVGGVVVGFPLSLGLGYPYFTISFNIGGLVAGIGLVWVVFGGAMTGLLKVS